MSRVHASLCCVALVVVTAIVAGQDEQRRSGTPAGVQSEPLRTPWGHPDLQGIWTNATDTPLERPAHAVGKPVLSPEELTQREKAAAANLANEPAVVKGDPGTYNAFWRDPIKPTGRTSLIIDPPDGRLPPLTAAASKRREERAVDLKKFPFQRYDNPEDRPFFERCIGRGWPRVGGTYQFTYQIFRIPSTSFCSRRW
jgi:hypothetical protein